MPALSQKNLRKQETCQQSKYIVQTSSAVVAYGEVWCEDGAEVKKIFIPHSGTLDLAFGRNGT
jgi:hypothetical protein